MAEGKLKSINIKGKSYVQVNERVKAFRSNQEWQGWSIETDVHTLTDDVCVMCAQIKDQNGRVIATGWAREVRNDATSMVNKTSYVENCETSAVGRALGYLGIGIDENIYSAEELFFALQAQENAPSAPVTTKGGAIYPENKVAQEVAENTAKNEALLELLDGLRADMDSLQSYKELTALMLSERIQKSDYKEALLRAGHNFAEEKGWESRKDGKNGKQ